MAAKKKAAPELNATKAPRRRKKQPTSSAPGEGAKAHEWLMEALEQRESETKTTTDHDGPATTNVAKVEVSSENEKKKNKPWLIQPGEVRNPKGRPKGSRSKFQEEFISDFLADWKQGGVEAIAKVRREQPAAYLKVAATILPKQMDVRVSELAELTEDALDKKIAELSAQFTSALSILKPEVTH